MTEPTDLLIPGVTMLLLDALDKMYPDRCADPKDSEREIWMKVGQRRLVEFLHEQFKRQLG